MICPKGSAVARDGRRWCRPGGSEVVGQAAEALGDRLIKTPCCQSLPSRRTLATPERDAGGGVQPRVVELCECRADQRRIHSGGGQVMLDPRRPPPTAQPVLGQLVRVAHVIDGTKRGEALDRSAGGVVTVPAGEALLELAAGVRASSDQCCAADEGAFLSRLCLGLRDHVGVRRAPDIQPETGGSQGVEDNPRLAIELDGKA